jgi:hypothetical protein
MFAMQVWEILNSHRRVFIYLFNTGTGSDYEFEEIWDIWGDQVQGLAGFVPYMFAVGNHEHYYNYTSYRSRFLMPGEQSGGEGNFWYSIDYGTVHFTFFSTEHPYDVGTPQHNWIQQVIIYLIYIIFWKIIRT